MKVCAPTSVTLGVQENLPPGSMLLAEADEPGKESDKPYSCELKPVAAILNEILFLAKTEVPGESDCIVTDGVSAKANGVPKIRSATAPVTIRERFFICD